MFFFRRKEVLRGAWLAAVILGFAILADWAGWLNLAERKTIDLRMQATRAGRRLPDDIVVVLIDDASLHAMDPLVGRWPWPRTVHADLIEFLSRCGARAIVMDILFSEHQIDSAQAGSELGESDRRLVETSAEAGNIIYATQLVVDEPDAHNAEVLFNPLPEGFARRFALQTTGSFPAKGYNQCYAPFDDLTEVAADIGVVSFAPDSDGVFRSETLVFDYAGDFYPSLGMSVALRHFGGRTVAMGKDGIVLRHATGSIRIPVTDEGEYYINLYGEWPVFSYSGIMETKFEIEQGNIAHLPFRPEEFKGKTVFVGASAAAVEDLKQTSLRTRLPGVLLHAAVFGNILTRDFLLFTPPGTTYLLTGLMVVLTLFPILLFKGMSARAMTPVICLGLFLGVSGILFSRNIVVNTAVPSTAFILAYCCGFIHNIATEGRERRRIRNILGQYVSPAMLKEVLDKHKEDYLRAEVGSKELLTVFFSDIRDFTTISESHPVEVIVEMLNRYLSRMVAIIFQNDGTLDKFIGDAVVAFWGAPVKISDHAYKAVLSAIQMQHALAALNRENQAQNLPELRVGIGIHTGEVILGNIGSEKKLEYTVIGDSVNLTSRLEGLTKQYHSRILISQETYNQVRDKIVCRLVDFVRVKGKEKSIAIFEVVGETADADPDILMVSELSQTAYAQYQARCFAEAIQTQQQILTIQPDDFLAQMFIERCKTYLMNPPPEEWDGVYVHYNK